MKKLTFILFLAFAFCLSAVIGQKPYDPKAVIPPAPNVKIGTLPNGLKYYIKYNIKPEHKVELRLAVNAGAILEDDDQQGLAHFMEHMNFNGLEHFPGNELVKFLESIGVSFGNDLNAFTGFDETVYILPIPSDDPGKLEAGFNVIADWSGAALLTGEEIEKERGVILAESRIGKGADDRMMKKWLPVLMNNSKYGDRLPIGLDSIIDKFDHSSLHRFYRDWYRPNLQAVIVVGDMPVEQAEKMITEKFSRYKNPEYPRYRQPLFPVKPFFESRAMMVSDKEANYTQVSLVCSFQPQTRVTTEEDYLNKTIHGLFSKMLSARIDELKNSANPPFAFAYTYLGGWARGTENFNAIAICGNQQIQASINALITECMRAKKFGFTEAELSRAKAKTLAEYEQRYNERDKTESGTLVWEFVGNYFEGNAIPGIEWEYNFLKQNLDRVELGNFDRIRDKITYNDKYFCYVTAKSQPDLPSDDQLKKWVDNALKLPVEPYKENRVAASLLKSEPVAGTLIKTEKNDILGTTTLTLSNGVTVCLKPTDFKNDEIVFKGSRLGGFSLYGAEDYPSAQFSNNMVEEMGYGEFSRTDLEKFLSGRQVSVTPNIDKYTEWMEGNSTVKDLETMFQLLYLKSTSPRKNLEAYKSYISREKQQLESLKQSPEYLFMDSSYNSLYQGNKRAHLIENPSIYDKMDMEHAIQFYKERLCNANGLYYCFVGSFTVEKIIPLIEKYIASIPSGEIVKTYKDLGLFPAEGQKSFTLHKGSEKQAMLCHYFTGKMPFNPDDNFRLAQLNAILNDKVIDTIREKMSAIYGGGCNGAIAKYPREEFTIQSQFPCSPDNIEKVHTAFLGLIESTKVEGGITAEDLNRVREPAFEHYKENIKTNTYWLSGLQNAFLNGTDPVRITTYPQRLKDLTPEILVQTARKFYTNQNVFKAEWLPEIK
jgi:zinc protease